MSSSQCIIYWETCLFSPQEKISPLHREGKAEGNDDWKTQHLSTFEGLLNSSPRILEVDCWKFIEPLIMQTDRGCVQASVTDSESFTKQLFIPAEADLIAGCQVWSRYPSDPHLCQTDYSSHAVLTDQVASERSEQQSLRGYCTKLPFPPSHHLTH